MKRALPPDPFVRILSPRDIPAYIALRREMLADAPWAFMASPGSDHGSNAAFLRRILRKPSGQNTILGAFEGGRLLASAGIFREEAPKRRHVAVIWGVYATPASRGLGLGRAVTKAAIELARTWSRAGDPVTSVELAVSERAVAAQRLYTSLGFRAWGREPDALRLKGRSYSEIHMYLPLRGARKEKRP